MEEKPVNNRTNTGKFKKGESGNPAGRPKGAKDKIARSVKKDIEETFERLGGIDGLVEWAKKSPRNQSKLYDWYFSMLPKNVDADVMGDLGLTIRRVITDDTPKE